MMWISLDRARETCFFDCRFNICFHPLGVVLFFGPCFFVCFKTVEGILYALQFGCEDGDEWLCPSSITLP